MKWTVLNAVGAVVWLTGLSLAKGTIVPTSVLAAVGDQHVVVGMTLGLLGLALLLWTNFRTTA